LPRQAAQYAASFTAEGTSWTGCTNILLQELRFGTLCYSMRSSQDRTRLPVFNFKMCFHSIPLSIINKTGNIRINVTWTCVRATIVAVGKQ
jgi:hypothetical protein